LAVNPQGPKPCLGAKERLPAALKGVRAPTGLNLGSPGYFSVRKSFRFSKSAGSPLTAFAAFRYTDHTNEQMFYSVTAQPGVV
ncbi:MAG: hypothetical protein ACUVSU_12225, partial [Aggregatilineaceae bacterium]